MIEEASDEISYDLPYKKNDKDDKDKKKNISHLLEAIMDTLIDLELLTFFHRHPFTMDTAKNIAMWVNRDEVHIKQNLEKLVSLGIMDKIGSEDAFVVYSYTQDPELISVIERFLSELQKRFIPPHKR